MHRGGTFAGSHNPPIVGHRSIQHVTRVGAPAQRRVLLGRSLGAVASLTPVNRLYPNSSTRSQGVAHAHHRGRHINMILTPPPGGGETYTPDFFRVPRGPISTSRGGRLLTARPFFAVSGTHSLPVPFFGWHGPLVCTGFGLKVYLCPPVKVRHSFPRPPR